MTVDPAIRRANRWVFFALVMFAVGLCLACLLWMRHVTRRSGGVVYPPAAPLFALRQKSPAFAFYSTSFSLT